MSKAFNPDYFASGQKINVEALIAKPIKQVNYMLFMKAPNPGDDKKLKAEKVEIMALNSAEE